MRSRLIINCKNGILQFWGPISRSSSKIAAKVPHGIESASAQTPARAPKACARASARRVEAASSNGIDNQLSFFRQRVGAADLLERAVQSAVLKLSSAAFAPQSHHHVDANDFIALGRRRRPADRYL